MKEEKTLLVGGMDLMLKPKISNFEEFRRTNFVRDNKYLIYYDGANYWKIDKEIGLPAIGKQIEKFITGDNTFREENFDKGIGFIPILFYNSLIEFKEIPAKIGVWFKALESFLKDGETVELPSYSLEHKYISRGTQRIAVLRGTGLDFFYDWLNRVYAEKIRIKVCEAEFCNRIFIPSRKDQRFCSETCRGKTYLERKKELLNKKFDLK